MKDEKRDKSFKKNKEVESILKTLESLLSPVEQKLVEETNSSDYSPIFILGCARSGTTITHQYLINSIKSIYPSNFLSRFYASPVLGGMILKLFTELDTKGELLGDLNKEYFASDLGKTKGALSPNEFWYFWRKHFSINKKGTIDDTKLNEKSLNRFKGSIFGLQNLFQAPFIAKGLIANNCPNLIEQIFPNAIFIHIEREIISNANSILNGRMNFFGNTKEWYSFYPKSPSEYEKMTDEEQVLRQVMDTNNEINKGAESLKRNRVIKINYEDFCEDPNRLLTQIKELDSTIELTGKEIANIKIQPETKCQLEQKSKLTQVLKDLNI